MAQLFSGRELAPLWPRMQERLRKTNLQNFFDYLQGLALPARSDFLVNLGFPELVSLTSPARQVLEDRLAGFQRCARRPKRFL